MKKQVKKWLTFAMAVMLILGSINYNPLFASATVRDEAEYDDSVTGGDADGIIIDGEESVSDSDGTVSGDASRVGKGRRLVLTRSARASEGTYTITVNASALGHNWS
ncbi:MAG: hypothetical protein NC548_41005, partial [Lachnospiraceae bacterium]|nr:hypothetical protein [Lachnospiraceae bacterium]